MDPVNNSQQVEPPPVTPVINQTPPSPSPQRKKGKLGIIISLVIILFLLSVSAVAGFVIYKNLNKQPEQVACTMEAKICPDGSSVGRTGPNCEFTPCPNANPDPTADWNTYSDDIYNYTIQYPSEIYISYSNRFDYKKLKPVDNTNIGHVSITIYEYDKNMSLSQMIEKYNLGIFADNHEFIKPKFIDTHKYEWDTKSLKIITNSLEQYYIPEEKYFIVISRYVVLDEFDILSTLKFTDPDSKIDPFPSWTSYKGKGFTFKYPSNRFLVRGGGEEDGDIMLITLGDFDYNFFITIDSPPHTLNYDESINKLVSELVDPITERLTNGIKISGIFGPIPYKQDLEINSVFIEMPPDNYVVVSSERDNVYFKNILSTFKFTN